jgi:DNA-binding NtrC family response regulator
MASPHYRLFPPTVLVVDDDDLVRWLMTRILEDECYRVIAAENGSIAWEVLKRGVPTVDAVVSDVVIPIMNGVELSQRIAELPNAPPLILVSAYPDPEAVLDHPFLPKPFEPGQLVTLVEHILHTVQLPNMAS